MHGVFVSNKQLRTITTQETPINHPKPPPGERGDLSDEQKRRDLGTLRFRDWRVWGVGRSGLTVLVVSKPGLRCWGHLGPSSGSTNNELMLGAVYHRLPGDSFRTAKDSDSRSL